MEEKIVICISNVSSPQKKKKNNPVIQKEKIKPQRVPAFLLVNSFHEWDVPSWIWEWCIFKFPFNLIWISEDFWPDVEISCVNTLHDGQFSPGWFLEQLDHGGTVGLVTAEPTVSLWCGSETPTPTPHPRRHRLLNVRCWWTDTSVHSRVHCLEDVIASDSLFVLISPGWSGPELQRCSRLLQRCSCATA